MSIKLLRHNKTTGDCGIVAAFNAAQWCNSPKTYKSIEKIAKTCGYNTQKGIFFFQFAHLLGKLRLPTKRIKPKSVKELENKLDAGKCLLILYTPSSDENGHAIMVFIDHTGRIIIINPQKNGPQTWWRFTWDLVLNGVRNLAVYELPRRSKRQ